MIQIQRGNLLEADAEALVNTVNCVGVMGKGIALQFKQAFPDNFRDYEKACQHKEVVPGKMLTFKTGTLLMPQYIINFPTKRHWRGKSRIEDIKSGLSALIAEVKRLRIKSIALPPLGCGNGGLAWNQVRLLIESAFSALPLVKVFLYEPYGSPLPSKMPVRTKVPKMTRSRALFICLIDRYRIHEYRLTLLEMQKVAFFLQCAGEPLRLNFVKHTYGPYADNLNHVLQAMEGHFVRGYGDRSKGAQIYALAEGIKQAREALEDDDRAKQTLQSVSDLIEGFETPYGMELLASTLWIAAMENEKAKTEPEVAIRDFHEWNSRKRKIFRQEHIRKAWQRLQMQGWFERKACCQTLP
jgi:O-acetyl-ADP-ribose deacetylase (regulator of RNase III)